MLVISFVFALVSAGGFGQTCHSDGSCDAGLVCNAGICGKPSGNGQPNGCGTINFANNAGATAVAVPASGAIPSPSGIVANPSISAPTAAFNGPSGITVTDVSGAVFTVSAFAPIPSNVAGVIATATSTTSASRSLPSSNSASFVAVGAIVALPILLL